MEYTSESLPRTALLVDYPILLRSIRTVDADAVPNISEIVQRAAADSPLLCARAFGAWYDADEALQAFTEGLTPVFVPPAGPTGAPTTSALVAEGLELVLSGAVETLILSGDERLLPLIAASVAAGVRVGLVAHSCATGGACMLLAEFAEPASTYARSLTRAERYRRPQSAPRSA